MEGVEEFLELFYINEWLNVTGQPTPVAAQSKARVCGRLLAGAVASNHAGGHRCLFLVSC